MFVVAQLEDDIRVQPANLEKPRHVAVAEVIEELYFDKVLPDVVSSPPGRVPAYTGVVTSNTR